jgi:hypothetical protein
MRKVSAFLDLVFAAVAIMPAIATAQMNDQKSGVMPPPQVISIGVEQVKHGKVSAHEKNEIAWVEALIRAKYHEFWALESLTSTSEVMFLTPFPSYGAYESNYRTATAAGAVHSIGTQYSAAEADDVSSKTEMLVTYREDLSYGALINIGEYRYVTITTTKVRPGHNSDYFELLKTINEASKAASSDTHVAVYEVTSGTPTGTFLTFTFSKSLAEMDSTNPAMTQAMAGVQQRINELVEKAVLETSSAIYRFNPKMSNPCDQIAAADPAFWKPEVIMTKATAPADARPAAKRTTGR